MKEDGEQAGGIPGFQWDDFQNRFFGDGHWRESLQPGAGVPWVEEYVRGIIADVVPGAAGSLPPKPAKMAASSVNVFETHDLVVVRLRWPQAGSGSPPKVLAAIHELTVENADGQRHSAKLPCFVRPEAAKAVWKDGVLEVKLPKEGKPRYKEVPVEYR